MKLPLLVSFLLLQVHSTYSQCTFSYEFEKIDPNCRKNNGTVMAFTNAVKPVFTLISSTQTITQNDSVFSGLKQDNYTLIIKDETGCTRSSSFYLVNEPVTDLKNSEIRHYILNDKRIVLSNEAQAIEKVWDFGDNQTDYGGEILHTYNAAGTYKIKLKTTYQCLGVDTSSITVTIPEQKYKIDTIGSVLRVNNLKFPHSDAQVYSCNCNNKAFIWTRKISESSQNKLYAFDFNAKTLIELPIPPGNFPTDRKWYYSQLKLEDITACKDGKFYYSGHTLADGIQLVRSDGTVSGTMAIPHQNPGERYFEPEKFLIYQDELYFNANKMVNSEIVPGLYKLNANTIQQLDRNAISFFNVFYYPRVFSNKIIDFKSSALVVHETNTTDMKIIANFDPQVSYEYLPLGEKGAYFYFLLKFNDTAALWRTDNTIAGTIKIKEFEAYTLPVESIFYKDRFYFPMTTTAHGQEPWSSDGTADGTKMLIDIYNLGHSGSNPAGFIVHDDKLYFTAYTVYQKRQLFVTEGTLSSTRKLSNVPVNVRAVVGFSRDKVYMSHEFNDVYVYDLKRNRTLQLFKSGRGYDDNGREPKAMVKNGNDSYLLMLDVDDAEGYTKFFTECDSYRPYFNDMYLSYGISENIGTYSVVGNPGSTFYWYQFPEMENPSAINTKTFVAKFFDTPIRVAAREPDGCTSPLAIPIQYWSEKSEWFRGARRCQPYKLLFSYSPSNGGKEVPNGFRAVMYDVSDYEHPIPLTLTPINATEFTVDLPTYVGLNANYNYKVSIRRITDENYSYLLESIPAYLKNSLSVFDDAMVLQGDSARVTIRQRVNLKGANIFVNFNGSELNIPITPFDVKFRPAETGIYKVSSFRDACGNTDILKSEVKITVKTPCNQSLNHTGTIAPLAYYSNTNISSSAIVVSNKTVEYNATKHIILEPGFSVNPNGTFTASIKNCQ